MKCQFLGGSDEVGNLAMVLELEDMRFLFDYGMSPGKPTPIRPVQNMSGIICINDNMQPRFFPPKKTP